MDMKERPEPIRAEKKSSRGRWQDSHIVTFVLPILCILLIPLGGFPYLYGRLNLHPWLTTCMLCPATAVFLVYCFCSGIWRLASGWRRHSQRKKALLAVEISIPVLFVLLFVMQFLGPHRLQLWPDAGPFLYGFRDRIRSKADIPAIRAWLKTLDEDYYIPHSNRLPREKWPKSLKALKPPRVIVAPDKNRNPRVLITWGGGFMHWRVDIGIEGMVTTEFDSDPSYASWLVVEPGVYVSDW